MSWRSARTFDRRRLRPLSSRGISAVDRVREWRRAAAVARHYRDEEVSRPGRCPPTGTGRGHCQGDTSTTLLGGRTRRGKPGRRRRIAVGGTQDDHARGPLIRARLLLLQRGVRRRGRTRLPPRGPWHRDRADHRDTGRRLHADRRRGQHQPRRDAGADRRVSTALLPNGRARAHGARQHEHDRVRRRRRTRPPRHRRADPTRRPYL